MDYHFKSKKQFTRNDKCQPDNYYINECLEIFEKIYNNIEYPIKEIYVTGYGGQGSGSLFVVIEYKENEKIFELSIEVVHEDHDINITIKMDNNSKYYEDYPKIIQEKIYEWKEN